MPKATLYTKDYCPYCTAAKKLLRSKGYTFTEIDVAADPKKLQEMFKRTNNSRTVPQIFLENEHIGGYDDLTIYLRNINAA